MDNWNDTAIEAVLEQLIDDLGARGMRGVGFIVSDDYAGLRAARRAVLGLATWQRCQFPLAGNAIHHAPNVAIRDRIGSKLRSVRSRFAGKGTGRARRARHRLYSKAATKLATWLENTT